MEIKESVLKEIIAKVVEETLKKPKTDSFEKCADPSGIMRIATETVKCEPFAGEAGVYLKDVTSLEEAPRMGAGIMELDHTSFEWTLTYDEFDYVIDGELEIEIDGRLVKGNKGDIIYIPKDSHIHFQTPSTARFAYFVYPADWQ